MKNYQFKDIARTYKNNGQHLEQVARYNLLGTIEKADNVPATKAGDITFNGYEYQVKSQKATVAKGTYKDFCEFVDNADKADKYLFITLSLTAYEMNKQEYKEFIKLFGSQGRASSKNGGGLVLRIKPESKKMIEYLEGK